MRLCLETIAEACGSGIPADAKSTVVTSVVTDSRRAVLGSLFVCIPGERVDGHDFAVKAVENGACAVLAQRPKLAPYVPEMRRNLAQAMGLDVSCVSVKATTEEALGFTGREEGMASHAVALIEKCR